MNGFKIITIQGSFPGGKPYSNALIQTKTEPALNNNSFPFKKSTNGMNVYVLQASRLNLNGDGFPLPGEVLQKMENVFNADFHDVRIHTGSGQAESIGALAFATGNDIYFAQGRYNPYLPHGERLLAHELTHVVQQKTGKTQNPFGYGVTVVQSPGLEAEAERMGLRAIQMVKQNISSNSKKIKKIPKSVDSVIDDSLTEKFIGSGARLKGLNNQWVDIKKVSRQKKMRWFSKKILNKMGITPKPKKAICPICKKNATSFNLDHMTPWRSYVSVLASEKNLKKESGNTMVRYSVAKSLYNDPENLWWICESCNKKKSDIITDNPSNVFTGVSGRKAGLFFSSKV